MTNTENLFLRPAKTLRLPCEKAVFIENAQLAEKKLKHKGHHLFLKRVFDIAFSLFLIVLLSPVFFTTAILVKSTSKGGVFYLHERVGYKGRRFKCYKFRSMVTNQSVKLQDYQKAMVLQQDGLLYKAPRDTRITRVGRIIRKTSIDELPQLFNVLFNDMSIVGPRPLVQFMLKDYPEFTEVRNLVKPGITGLWQIRERALNTSAAYMIKHDLEYINNVSVLLDIKILLKTTRVVLTCDGAL